MEANTLAKVPTPTQGIPKLRYKVKELLSALPEAHRVRIRDKVMRACSISPATFSRYINLRTHDIGDIPARVLREFAFWLTCSMEDLFNPEK